MKTTFKKVALASALAATTAIVAPSLAHAAGAAMTAAKTSSVYNAPFTTAFQAPFGARVQISVNRNSDTSLTTGNLDGMELVAFLYDASNNYIGYVRSGAQASKAADVVTDTVTLPSAASGATKAAFAFLQYGNETNATTNADDTIGGFAAGAGALLVVPGATENAATISAVDISSITGGAIGLQGASAANLNEIGALATIKAGAVAMTSSYTGPTLVSAGKDQLTPNYVKLTFDAVLGTVGNGASVATQVKPKAGATTETTVTESTSKTDPAGTKNVYIEKGAATAFTTAIDTVDIAFLTGSAAANAIQDRAGNHAKPVTGVTVTQFAAPAYAAAGKVMLANTLTANGSGLVLANLFTTNGATAADGSASIDVSVRMSEAIGSNVNAAGDFALSSGLTFGSVQTATGTTLKVRLTLAAGKWRYNLTTGELEFSSDNGATWTAQTVALASETGSKITTAENQALNSALAATKIVAAEAPAAGGLKTLDNDANGELDGATVDFGVALATPLAANNGVTISKRTDATKKAAVTVSVDAAAPSVLKMVAPEATIEGWLAAGETKGANLNTGVTGATLPYAAGVTTSDITYKAVYDVATGDLKKIPDVASAAPGTDGAKPVILSAQYLPEQGTSPAAGQLKIVASEALNNVTALDAAQIMLGGSSLQLLNLNDGVTALGANDAALSKTTVTNDTVTIGLTGAGNGKVTASVVNKAITLNANTTSGIRDTNNVANFLATNGSITVGTGTTVYSGPKIAQAIGIRASTDPASNITQVLVKFDKGVQLATGGALVDGMFKVQGTVGSNNYIVAVPAAKTDITQAASGYVTLTLPDPGLKGSLTDLRVEYDANGVNNSGTASANRLVSTDTPATEITESATAFDNTGDDSKSVSFSKNSTQLYTMEVKGTLTADGTAAAAKGTIIRADLVDFGYATEVKGGNLNVPCSCAANSNIAVASFGTIAADIDNNVKLGKTSTKAYVRVKLSARQDAVAGIDMVGEAAGPGGSSDSLRVYEVSVDNKTGAVTGNGVTGSLALANKPSLDILDTVYQVTNDGKFRFSIGNEKAPKNAFVLTSVKQPADAVFKAVTSPVDVFKNYVPFASNVTASGTIGADLGSINLANIKSTSLAATTDWQLVGLNGTFDLKTANQTSGATTVSNKPVALDRLLISVRGSTGEPITAWSFDNSDDEAFTLVNNVVNSALQIGDVAIDNSKIVQAGPALALKNPTKQFSYDANGNGTIVAGEGATNISAAEPFNVYYPVTSANSKDLSVDAGKWSLVSMDAAVADLAAWANTNKVGAIIVVGSGNYQKAWFKGATDNTLASLAAGDRAFVYFEAANAAFKFGR